MANAAPQYATPVASLAEDDRIAFMVRVYQHLALAIVAFIGFEFLLFSTGFAEWFYELIIGRGGVWLLVLGLFMLGGWVTTQATMDLDNPSRQYSGLFGQAAIYAVLFAPTLYWVFVEKDSAGEVWSAALITAVGFGGLSVTAWFTRRDLSFLRPLIMWGAMASMLLIVFAIIFGANLGTWFSVGMVALMGASILYNTQAIMRRYPPQAHIAAAVGLFGSVMIMFYYVLRIVSSR